MQAHQSIIQYMRRCAYDSSGTVLYMKNWTRRRFLMCGWKSRFYWNWSDWWTWHEQFAT